MAEGGDFGDDGYPPNHNENINKSISGNHETPNNESTNSREVSDADNLQENSDDRRKKRDENPFSFKKFLKSGGARPKSGDSIYNSTNVRSGGLANLDLANDLPDFVQSHSSENVRVIPEVSLHAHSEERRRPRKPPSDISFPDLTSNNENNKHNSDLNAISPSYNVQRNGISPPPSCSSLDNLPGSYTTNNQIISESSHNENFSERYNSNEIAQLQSAHMMGCLPDFLSDSALNLNDNRISPGIISSEELRNNPQLCENELLRVREENRQLRKQLEEARHFAEAESKRVSDVMNEMHLIRKKESEESAALENMVRKVEANLTKTQQRAETAEALVVKLKQEVKNSKGQMQSMMLGGAVNSNGPRVTDAVREKTKYASEQIYGAVQLAENNLKDLLKGVDTLRLVAQVLESIDKIQNTSDSQNEKDNSTNEHNNEK